jgi:methionine-rich copper-binding protein CopC
MKALHRARRDWLVAMLMCLVIVSLSITLVAAHSATVTNSDPADGATLMRSPSQVLAQFDEELDTDGSTMKVTDAAGKQVSEGNGKVDLNDPEHQKMIALLPKPLAVGNSLDRMWQCHDRTA